MIEETPFLSYLTIFKARLGNLNLVLGLTSLGFQPGPTIERKLREALSKKVVVGKDEASYKAMLAYLLEKNLVSSTPRSKGRYRSVCVKADQSISVDGAPTSSVPVFETDYWLATAAATSTVGAPTLENLSEILEMAYDLRIISRTRNNWTVAGQAAAAFREHFSKGETNPYNLGAEAVLYLRQVLAEDGPVFAAVVDALANGPSRFRKERVISAFPTYIKAVNDRIQTLPNFSPPQKTASKAFAKLIDRAGAKQSEGKVAGVLDHRVSPRLEWLADLGALSKPSHRNAFEYVTTEDLGNLTRALGGLESSDKFWAEDAALRYWRTATHFSRFREQASTLSIRDALKSGYSLVQRSIAPTSIREVCFCAGILTPSLPATMSEFYKELIAWALSDKSVAISGGRYSRQPELVQIKTK